MLYVESMITLVYVTRENVAEDHINPRLEISSIVDAGRRCHFGSNTIRETRTGSQVFSRESAGTLQPNTRTNTLTQQ